jgi:hypothetical protein
MIFSGKEYFTAVNYGMAVGKSIDMPVQNDTFSDKFGVLQVIASFYIITYVIANDYFIRIT